ARRRALTVSELTGRIQGALEVEFFDVWVEGEVSNLKIVPAGHWYFSLKDEQALLRAVAWKTQTRLIKFRPRDGMKVLVRGGLKVYPPRGEYQLQVEVVEPLGKGALQQAYEELKERLAGEGLFAAERKRPLPMLPRCVGVITSPSGAVVQDILRVLSRRYANLGVLIYPARVQGEDAAPEIVQGLRALNRLRGLDVIILARGGGSLEDLWPFNEERVARAISASKVPTISAVGHETDFTIADFVADHRAPTPSAAAELVVKAKEDLRGRIDGLTHRLSAAMDLRLTRTRARVQALTEHRVFEAERARIRAHLLAVAELRRRAEAGLRRLAEQGREGLARTRGRLEAFRWDRQVADRRRRVAEETRRLQELLRGRTQRGRSTLERLAGKLETLSPLSVLSRGYALAWDERGRLLRDSAQAAAGETVRLRLARGGLTARVTAREDEA
ncbi:MAG TPA: exodeoxyribonuclease VII large subunit, partial [Vicinamibacteria bacterium]|nr:exodeoxyribonuclease VII large subunit [Vicinamibacteria bacterium]